MEVIMATASTEKAKAEQMGGHTVFSEVQHESTCTRCGGLMVQDYCLDVLGNIGESEFAAKRCVQCGEVVDPVILRNRGTRQEPMTVQLAGKMLPNNCVTIGR
jgi:Pyruvate/2-oxoacid:ferredoxin oxidoreductase delta subunit